MGDGDDDQGDAEQQPVASSTSVVSRYKPVIDASATGLRAGVCAACQNRKGDQQGTRSYPRRRSAVSIATSTREVMPGTSTGRRPAT